MKLQDKVALITGGSRDRKSLCTQLAAEGAHDHFLRINSTAADNTVAEIIEQGGKAKLFSLMLGMPRQ